MAFLFCQLAYATASTMLNRDITWLWDLSIGLLVIAVAYVIYTSIQFFAIVLKEL